MDLLEVKLFLCVVGGLGTPAFFLVEYQVSLSKEIQCQYSSHYSIIEAEGILPSLFYEDSVTKATQRVHKEKNYSPIFLMNIEIKILNKILKN